jgi:hypothetical protein
VTSNGAGVDEGAADGSVDTSDPTSDSGAVTSTVQLQSEATQSAETDAQAASDAAAAAVLQLHSEATQIAEIDAQAASDAALAAAAAVFSPSSEGASPGWITSCGYSHSNNEDPIVHPGHPGAAHLHDYSAARTTGHSSTPDSLRAGGSTCDTAGDTSAYWIPALFEDGERVLPTATRMNSLFYYRRKGAPDGTTVQPFPDGLKMIIGNASATSPVENPQLGTDIIFKCGPGSTEDLPAPPSRCDSGVMVMSLRFPNCWDGVNLDSADHRSHMAYPMGSRCPASHPVVLPRLESFFRYDVGTGPIGEISLSSGPYYTAHQDFFNAWVPSSLQTLLANCINAMADCGKNPLR